MREITGIAKQAVTGLVAMSLALALASAIKPLGDVVFGDQYDSFRS
jgi:hypothetical protein